MERKTLAEESGAEATTVHTLREKGRPVNSAERLDCARLTAAFVPPAVTLQTKSPLLLKWNSPFAVYHRGVDFSGEIQNGLVGFRKLPVVRDRNEVSE